MHNKAICSRFFLIKILVHVVHNKSTHTHNNNMFICTYWVWSVKKDIVSVETSSMLHSTARAINLPEKGFPLFHISPHFLRAGGAIELAIAGHSIITTQKYGC